MSWRPCPYCMHRVRITTRGLFAVHRIWRGAVECPGSRLTPEDAHAEVRKDRGDGGEQ